MTSAAKRLIQQTCLCAGIIMLMSPSSQGQGFDTLENTNLYAVNPGGPWGNGVVRVDSLWLGAAFLRDTNKLFRVWVAPGNSAGWTGDLYLFVPHGANNGGDTSIYLFHNQNNGTAPTNIDLTNNPVVRAHIRHKDTIFFRYTATPNGIANTGYSGPNRAPGEGWKATDYIYSPNYSPQTITVANGVTTVVGRRWCTAGWIRNTALPPATARTDTVFFAFEDNHNLAGNGFASDFDFNDVLFKVTGVYLMSPPTDIGIRVFPSDTIRAGEFATIIGTLRDNEGNVVPFLSDSIRWSLLRNAVIRPGDTVIGSPNDSVRFTGTVAYRRVGIIGTYGNVRDTTYIYIIPNVPTQVDIEFQSPTVLTANYVLSTLDTFRVRPRQTINFDSSQTIKYAYAVLRDQYGNFVRLADATAWTSDNTAIVTSAATAGKVFEGAITRVALSGTTLVIASQGTLKPDTATIVLQSGRIIALRLVNILNPTVALDTIRMNTDQSMTIQVQGIWSTAPGVWVDVTGFWSTIPANSLPSATPLPVTETGLWVFDPTAADTAVLRVTNGSVQVNVPVFVWDAPPFKLTLLLVTNPDSCFAGQPIKIAAYIENRDGPVHGTYTGPGTYRDMLDNSLRALQPWLSVNPPAIDSLNRQLQETWLNGADTIQLTLYYAPLDPDSLHQIQLSLNTGVNGVLTAKTIPFRLRPGPIDSIQIEDQGGRHLTQTQNLTYPNGLVTLFVNAFDPYGNRIDNTIREGQVLNQTVWNTDGTLHQPQYTLGQNIFYSAQNVLYDEQGLMWATLTIGTQTFKDNVPIRITAAPARLDSAITRDINGNGLIDRIDLTFDKIVVIDKDSTGRFIIKYVVGTTTYTLVADSIVPLTGTSYAVYIREQQTAVPQTSWKPTVTITSLPGVQDAINLRATDGCPPVIWKAEKHITGPERSTDTVRVYMSEKVQNPNGSNFSLANQPPQTFNVWLLTPAGWVLDPVMLQGIISFSRIEYDSILCFVMTNGNDITTSNWLNIIAANRPLRDAAGNFPAENNQRVQVSIFGNHIDIITYPNPSRGTLVRQPEGTLLFEHQTNARTWVQADRAGTVIRLVNVPVPPVGSKGRVKGIIKVSDPVGNIVNWAESEDILNKIDNRNSSGAQVDIYWNGSNKQGMMVAAGVYRAVVYLQYIDFPPTTAHPKNTKLIQKVGIAK